MYHATPDCTVTINMSDGTQTEQQAQPPVTQVDCMMKQRNEEMQRRFDAVSDMQCRGGIGGFEQRADAAAVHCSFRDPECVFYVFSTSHIGVPPLATRPQDAAVRFCGGFASAEDATRHANELAKCDKDCSLQIASSHRWVLLCDEIAKIEDPVYSSTKIDSMLAEHTAALNRSAAQFKKYVSDPDEYRSQTTPEVTAKERGTQQPQRDVPNSTTTCNGRFCRDLEIRGQSFAVVSFMLDDEGEGRCEHAICLWAILDSVAECDTYVRSVAGDRV